MLYNTAIALALAAGAAAAPQGVVYVTDVVKQTTTYCPAGGTLHLHLRFLIVLY